MAHKTAAEDAGRDEIETELIERIYKMAIRPQAYDDFMEKWAEYVDAALDELSSLKEEVEGEDPARFDRLARHFDMGFRLLEELGRSDPGAGGGTGQSTSAAASMLIDRFGQIVWHNGSASRFFALQRLSHSSELPLWDRSREELARLIARLEHEDGATLSKTLLRLHSAAADRTVFMMSERADNGDGEALIVLNQILTSWHESIGTMLADSFGLSEAEVQIAHQLVEGTKIAEIAERRDSAVSTVRTQVKSLLAKTGVNSQTELMRLLVSLNAAADAAQRRETHVRRGQTFRFRQRDDRVVPFHRFGPETGRPFIMFHGMLDGCDLNDVAIAELHRHDICLIAPERPFFGSAAGVSGDIRSAPEAVARDVEDLLDHLRLDRVGLMGHMAGSVYAFAAAGHLGPRVHSVTCVSGGVPILSTEQFAIMSARQRLVALTARYTPKLLPFILRAGIRQLDFGGEDSFMRALYETSPKDLEAITDTETSRIIAAGYQFSVAQGHRAFEIDSYHVVRDWSWRVEASDVPVTLVHGAHDPVVGCSSVRAFADRLGARATLHVLDDVGQLVLYRSPKTVVEALAAHL